MFLVQKKCTPLDCELVFIIKKRLCFMQRRYLYPYIFDV